MCYLYLYSYITHTHTHRSGPITNPTFAYVPRSCPARELPPPLPLFRPEWAAWPADPTPD